MDDNNFLKGINDFLEKCYELKNSFTSDLEIQQESLKILKILSQIKIFISNSFGRNSEYYRSVDYTAGTYDRLLLDKIIVGLESVKDSFSYDFVSKVSSVDNSSNIGLKYFEFGDNEEILAQFPDQSEPKS